ncbi:hypothetical protein ACOMHN_025946 [Nucella lapillus]
MPQQMTQQTWTLVLDGNNLLLISNNNDDNNNNDNNNNNSDSLLEFLAANPLSGSMEEETAAETSNKCSEAEWSADMAGDLPLLDFSALTSVLEGEEKDQDIPSTMLKEGQGEESVFQDEQTCAAPCGVGGAVSGGVGPDMAGLWGSGSLSTPSPTLLTPPPTTPWQFTSTLPTTTSPQSRPSLFAGTSFPFMSTSDHGHCNSSVATLPPVPVSPGSAHMPCPSITSQTHFPSVGDDVSSSSSDVSTPGFDDVTSFSDAIMSGICVPTSPNEVITLEANDLRLPDYARAPSVDTLTSLNDVSGPEVRAVTSGNGSQCLLLLPGTALDKMAEEKMAAKAAAVLEMCSLTPLVKEELKYTIQCRRLKAGQAEIVIPANNTRRRPRRRRTMLSAEDREREDKRRGQNRQAAQRFRQKQRDTEIVLSKKCRKLDGANTGLREEIQRLAREVQQLQHAMDCHLPACRKSPDPTTH